MYIQRGVIESDLCVCMISRRTADEGGEAYPRNIETLFPRSQFQSNRTYTDTQPWVYMSTVA